MYIALRPVSIAGHTYRVGGAIPPEDVLDPPQLIKAGVICEAPAPAAGPEDGGPSSPVPEGNPPASTTEGAALPKPAAPKRKPAQKGAPHAGG